jgi:YidC/Oxa1 family membrane protein insertase
MTKTQMIQPKLKEIQNKYKNDPQKLQQAQMELYKNEGVNPMAGCLPLLIQMPILFSIFYVFRDYPFQGQGFLWIPDLNKPDPIWILPIISGVSTYVSTILSAPKGQDNAQNPASSKTMNLVMSGFFLYVSLTMHAGLVLYWVVNNILQMAMQYALNKAMYKQVETAAIK